MASILDIALIAGTSYNDTRSAINRFPVPQGWTLHSAVPSDGSTGFEARTFKKGTETVIGYAGTDSESGFFAPDWQTNRALASGTWSEQLLQAAEYDLRVKRTNPSSSNYYEQLMRD